MAVLEPPRCWECREPDACPPWCAGYVTDGKYIQLIQCYIHNVFEILPANAYKVCFECKHVYATAEDLENAYLRIVCEIEGWVMARRQAEMIFFCQHCLHDF